MKEDVFPDFIARLPEADVPFPDVKIRLLQGENAQAAFTDNATKGEAEEHSHCAQWGIVVEGQMELTINGITKIYRKGDYYYIPDGALHSGKFNTRVRTIDVFAEPDRYHVKE